MNGRDWTTWRTWRLMIVCVPSLPATGMRRRETALANCSKQREACLLPVEPQPLACLAVKALRLCTMNFLQPVYLHRPHLASELLDCHKTTAGGILPRPRPSCNRIQTHLGGWITWIWTLHHQWNEALTSAGTTPVRLSLSCWWISSNKPVSDPSTLVQNQHACPPSECPTCRSLHRDLAATWTCLTAELGDVSLVKILMPPWFQTLSYRVEGSTEPTLTWCERHWISLKCSDPHIVSAEEPQTASLQRCMSVVSTVHQLLIEEVSRLLGVAFLHLWECRIDTSLDPGWTRHWGRHQSTPHPFQGKHLVWGWNTPFLVAPLK